MVLTVLYDLLVVLDRLEEEKVSNYVQKKTRNVEQRVFSSGKHIPLCLFAIKRSVMSN